MKADPRWNGPDGYPFAEIPVYSRPESNHYEAVDKRRRRLMEEGLTLFTRNDRPVRWRLPEAAAYRETHNVWQYNHRIGYLELIAWHNVIKGFTWAASQRRFHTARKDPYRLEWVGPFTEVWTDGLTSAEILAKLDDVLSIETKTYTRRGRYVDLRSWWFMSRTTDWRAMLDGLAPSGP